LIKRVEAGKPTPAWDNRPELYEDLYDVWSSFLKLHYQRGIGYEQEPISISDIRSWLEIYSIKDPDMKIKYFELITALDSSWRGWKSPGDPKKEENINANPASSD
jgi:hypothetical protein